MSTNSRGGHDSEGFARHGKGRRELGAHLPVQRHVQSPFGMHIQPRDVEGADSLQWAAHAEQRFQCRNHYPADRAPDSQPRQEVQSSRRLNLSDR